MYSKEDNKEMRVLLFAAVLNCLKLALSTCSKRLSNTENDCPVRGSAVAIEKSAFIALNYV